VKPEHVVEWLMFIPEEKALEVDLVAQKPMSEEQKFEWFTEIREVAYWGRLFTEKEREAAKRFAETQKSFIYRT